MQTMSKKDYMEDRKQKKAKYMKKMLAIFPMIFIWSGCTISIIQTDTHGTATDVVDAEASADADVEAEASVPIKGI